MRKFLLTILFPVLSGLSFYGNAQITPQEVIRQIQKGINLGNTLEPPTEGGWNNPKPQEYYFDLYKEAGFDVVRIPVRWDNYTLKSFPYTINSAWLNRVEEIVDWGLSRGLFVVINSHHDSWIKENYADPNQRARFDSIWSQISVHFKNKSEKLFFEVLNEPHGLTKTQNDDMHQRIISIIRKTNPTRMIIFQGHNWGGSDELLEAAIPDDDYLLGSFHSYDPYLFGLEGEGTWGSLADRQQLRNKFLAVKEWSDLHNIPVFLGEFGSLRSCNYNSRMRHYKYYVHLAREFGFSACAWDDGGDFKILERQAKYWDEVKDILIYSSPESPDNLTLKVYQDSIIKLSWENKLNRNDSIYIERRKSTNRSYRRIASLMPDAAEFPDTKPDTNFTYHYRVIAHFNDSTDIYSNPVRMFFPGYKIREKECFYENPFPVPGTIEAEDFDLGGENISYHESDAVNLGGAYRTEEAVDIFESEGKFLIFNVAPGEWYEYTVDVERERTYVVEAAVASAYDGGKFILSSKQVKSDTFTVASSGSWTNTTAVQGRIKLQCGKQVLRLQILSGPLFNIDKMTFSFDTSEELLPNTTNNSVTIYKESNKLTVHFSEPGFEIIRLYSINGTLIYSEPVNNDSNKTILPLKSGIYIFQAISKAGNFSKKIIIK